MNTQMNAQLQVRVQPGVRSNAVDGFKRNVLRLRVTAQPEHGAANEAVIALLAKALGIAKSRVVLVHGGSSRSKTFHIEGMDLAQVRAKLSATPAEGTGSSPGGG